MNAPVDSATKETDGNDWRHWVQPLITGSRRKSSIRSHRSLLPGDGIVVVGFVVLYVLTQSRHSEFATTTMLNIGLFVLLVVSLQLMLGFSNRASLAQAGVYGIGAYIAVYVELKLGLPIAIAAVASILGCGLFGFALAFPLSRLREHFLAMGTLAAQLLLSTAFLHLNGLTGGVNGEAPPAAHLNSFTVLVILFLFDVAAVVGLSHFRVSRRGREVLALRVDETMATSIGVNVPAMRLAVITVAFAITGLAGFMFTETAAFIAPDDFTLTISLGVLVAVILGGCSLRWGAIIGATVYSFLSAETVSYPGLATIIIGATLIVVLGYAPAGVSGINLMSARRLFGRLVDAPHSRHT